MTLRLDLEYDGTAFAGWQVQPGERTVQGVVEDALAVVWRTHVAVAGSGRTDAGVHARGQVAHVVVPDGVALDGQPAALDRLARSLGGLLPRDVALTALAVAPDGFHARYDARRRTYHYRIATAPRALDRHTRLVVRHALDLAAMNAAAAHLVGRHHFGAFCRTQSETENRVCTVEDAVWEPEKDGWDGNRREGDWRFRVSADRFLHGMVRAFVGTLLQVGRRRLPVDAIPEILASEDRRQAGPAAPPHGLVLWRVEYRDPAAVGGTRP